MAFCSEIRILKNHRSILSNIKISGYLDGTREKGGGTVRYNKNFILVFRMFFLSSYPGWVSSAQSKSLKGIVLISLDTLRVDHPAAERKGEQAIVFLSIQKEG